MEQKEWKSMFKKGAKCFHPDTGGTDTELNLWRVFADLVEGGFTNLEYENANAEFKKHQQAMKSIENSVIVEWYLKENK